MTTGGKKARERAARKAAIEAKKRKRRNLIIGALAVVVIGVVAFAVTRPEAAELAATETFPDLGAGDHLQPGDPVPVYNSSPATSGPHNPSAAACGIYTEELPDVTLVHNLEHGTVVVHYQPDLPADELATIEEFARSKPSHILVAPRAGLSDPVVLASWTRLLPISNGDLATLEVFYDRWARIGPEVGVQCPFAIDQSVG